jgi:hypothetical protein
MREVGSAMQVAKVAVVMRRQAILATGIVAAAMLTMSGCGPKSDRLAVSGNVNLNGAPLDNGTIRFTSIGSEKLMTSGALIQGGAFYVPQEKGLRAGSYQVEINSPDSAAPPILDRPSGMLMAPDRIPAAYNTESKQTIEVSIDGDNEFDFDIQSAPRK